jgi:hypothetical protein
MGKPFIRCAIKCSYSVTFAYHIASGLPETSDTQGVLNLKPYVLNQCRLLKLHLTLSYGEGWVRRLRKGLSKRHYVLNLNSRYIFALP